jgi:hypothetical protein
LRSERNLQWATIPCATICILKSLVLQCFPTDTKYGDFECWDREHSVLFSVFQLHVSTYTTPLVSVWGTVNVYARKNFGKADVGEDSAQTGCRAHPTSYRMGTGALSLGVMLPERQHDHSPLSSAEVKNAFPLYECASKNLRNGRLERELQMIQFSTIGCSSIAILWVSLVSFAAITLCVASQRVFIFVVYFVMHSVRKLLDTPSYAFMAWWLVKYRDNFNFFYPSLVQAK